MVQRYLPTGLSVRESAQCASFCLWKTRRKESSPSLRLKERAGCPFASHRSLTKQPSQSSSWLKSKTRGVSGGPASGGVYHARGMLQNDHQYPHRDTPSCQLLITLRYVNQTPAQAYRGLVYITRIVSPNALHNAGGDCIKCLCGCVSNSSMTR